MKYEDMSFKIMNEDNQEITYDIMSVIPNENDPDSPYVQFTDYMLEEDDDFIMQYGQIIKNGEEYSLKVITDKTIIDRIKFDLQEEVTSSVNRPSTKQYEILGGFMGETFYKRNDIGVNIEYTVVAKYKVEDKEYVIYTDFVDDENYLFRLYVDMVANGKSLTLSSSASQSIIEKFWDEIINYFDNAQSEV